MRTIPDPGFPGDDGSAPVALATALAAYDLAPEAQEATRYREALAALQDSRLLVPVMAVLGEVEYAEAPGDPVTSGLAHEKSSDMASVLMTGRDGRTALLAFTGSASLTDWNPEARPVPVPARQAAQAALQDGAEALLVDVAGPVLFVVEGDDLTSLAAGQVLVGLEDGQWGWLARG